MPFQKLKDFIIQVSKEEVSNEIVSFENTFSEVLNRSTTHQESVILLMGLAPHVIPGFYDQLIKEIHPEGGEFPEWGGVKDDAYRSMQPTGETVQHVLGGTNVNERIAVESLFSQEHWFYKEQVLYLESVREGMPFMSGKIILPPESLSLLIHGEITRPKFGPEFPAKELTTKMEWEHLVLGDATMKQLDHLKMWLNHHDVLRNNLGLDKFMNPGYRALFFGPSGTGKTLTVSLLGKQFQKPVFRIDLSQIVSKYVGETEKNLEKIFTRAENKDWILFFDEGDSIFGKRTTSRTAQDRFANQGVSYLLQRIESFDGVVILASNFKNNIDQAFLRRFNTVVNFAKPNAKERLKLWKMALPQNLNIENVHLENVAEAYELTGAQIVNAMTSSCLQAVEDKSDNISMPILQNAIRLEFQKEERMFVELN